MSLRLHSCAREGSDSRDLTRPRRTSCRLLCGLRSLGADEHSRPARMSRWRAAGALVARVATRGGVATSSRAHVAHPAHAWTHAAQSRTPPRRCPNTWDPIKRSLSSHPPAPPPKAPPSDGAVADAIASLPGLGVAFAVSQGGFAVADHISTAVGTPVAGVPLAILLGAAINNAVTLPRWVRPGLRTASGTVLRIGIVCVGAKLSASDLLESGTFALVPVLISVGAGLYLIPKIAKFAGLHPRLGSLLAAGTSICGVTAVSALAPAIAATQAEVSVAVANVVVWGSCAMLAAPHLAHSLLGKCSEAAGMWLGLAVHDTAQVMGAGLTYTQAYDDERAFKSATVTKLMRNMALAFAVPALAASHLAKGSFVNGSTGMTSKAIPFFLKAFVGMAVLRTCGDAYHATLADKSRGERWRHAMSALGDTFGAKVRLLLFAYGRLE